MEYEYYLSAVQAQLTEKEFEAAQREGRTWTIEQAIEYALSLPPVPKKKASEGPIGVGTTWRTVQKSIGQRIEAEAEVTEYASNRKFALRTTSGPFPLEIRQVFEPMEGGTRVSLRLEGEPGGLFKRAEPVVISMGKRNTEANLANLKDLMEAHTL